MEKLNWLKNRRTIEKLKEFSAFWLINIFWSIARFLFLINAHAQTEKSIVKIRSTALTEISLCKDYCSSEQKLFGFGEKKTFLTSCLTHFMPLIFYQYALKASENLWCSDVFRGYRKKPVAWNGLDRYSVFNFLKKDGPINCSKNIVQSLLKWKSCLFQWKSKNILFLVAKSSLFKSM